MAQKVYKKISGVWEEITNVWYKDGTMWKTGTIPWIKVSGVWKPCASTLSISCSPTSLSFDLIGRPNDQVITVTASAGVGWTASTVYSWLTITGGSGTGDGSFTIDADSTFDARIGSVSVSNDEGLPTINISIEQG